MKKSNQFLHKKTPLLKFQSENPYYLPKKQTNLYQLTHKIQNNNKNTASFHQSNQLNCIKRKYSDTAIKITEPKLTSQNTQVFIISNLKSQLSNLKQQVQKLISNDNQNSTSAREKSYKTLLKSGDSKPFFNSPRIQKKKLQNAKNLDQLQILKMQIKKLKKEGIENSDLIRELKTTNEKMSKILENAEHRFEQYKIKIEKQVTANQHQILSENQNLKNEISNIINRQKSLIEQKLQLQKRSQSQLKLKNLENQNLKNEYESKIKLLNNQSINQKSLIERNLNSSIQILKLQKIEIQRKYITIQKRIDQFQNQKKLKQLNITEVVNRKQKQIAILKQQINVLQKISANKESTVIQNQKYQKMIKSQENEIKKLQKQNDKLSQIRIKIEGQLESNKCKILELQTKSVKLQNEKNQFIKQIQSLKNIKQKFQLQSKQLTSTLKQIQMLKLTIKQKQSQIQFLKSNKKQIQNLQFQLRTLLKKREEQLIQLKTFKIDCIQNVNESLRNQLKAEVQNKKNLEQILRNTCFNYQQLYKSNQIQLSKRQQIIKNLCINIKNLQFEITKCHEMCRSFRSTQILLLEANEKIIKLEFQKLNKGLKQKYKQFQ